MARWIAAGTLDILQAALDPTWDAAGEADLDEDLTDIDLAQIIYTSGTTGAPKGAMMTHRAYLAGDCQKLRVWAAD